MLVFKDAFDAAVSEVQTQADRAVRCSRARNITSLAHVNRVTFGIYSRSAVAATERAECDRESIRAVALDCMKQYVAARREFVAACRQAREQQQQQKAAVEATNLISNMQQLYAKCEEAVSATHRQCDSQLKAWQQQRSELLQAHAQSIQHLQVCVGCLVTLKSVEVLVSRDFQGRLSHEISFRQNPALLVLGMPTRCVLLTPCPAGAVVSALCCR